MGMRHQSDASVVGPFLESLTQRRSERQNEAATATILKILERQRETLPDLLQNSGLSVTAFMRAFNEAQDAHLIMVTKKAEGEFVELTAMGSQVVKQMQA